MPRWRRRHQLAASGARVHAVYLHLAMSDRLLSPALALHPRDSHALTYPVEDVISAPRARGGLELRCSFRVGPTSDSFSREDVCLPRSVN